MKIDKQFVSTFLESLTKLSNDTLIFPNTSKRKFIIWHVEKPNSTWVSIEYQQGGFTHIIYAKDFKCNVTDVPYEYIYHELLKVLFLTVDSIGFLKDDRGKNINILSGKTLLSKGISELNKNDEHGK